MPDLVHRNEVANAAVKLWRGDNGSLEYLGDFANYVYSFIESGKTRYLRLTSSCDRTKEQIEAELDFAAGLVRRCRFVPLPDGLLRK
jgi:Ser/Thr protein kinase RdoA (MazF antagonist)